MSQEELRGLCDSGQEIAIIYLGGSQPGTQRVVSPLKMKGEILIALDIASNRVKNYSIGKIELLKEASLAPPYNADLAQETALIDRLSLRQMADVFTEDLSSLGWHVEPGETSIQLARHFKNGKPRKSADLVISYEEFVYSFEFDLDLGDFVEAKKLSVRPWRVSTLSASQRSFSLFSRAWIAFVNEARVHSPLRESD